VWDVNRKNLQALKGNQSVSLPPFSPLSTLQQGSSMKQLSKQDLKAFLERFSNFSGGELVKLDILSPTTFKISLTVQDKNRAFDWVDLNFELSGVNDAKLLDESALKAVDMDEGGNIKFTDKGIEVGFGSDEYLSSPLHIRAEVLKYEETSFSL